VAGGRAANGVEELQRFAGKPRAAERLERQAYQRAMVDLLRKQVLRAA
jgi:hypothetical protein